MELLTFVLYDIDRLRLKVASDCKDADLKRLQYSVFRGQMSPGQRGELLAKLLDRISDSRAFAIIIPVCERCARGIREVGEPIVRGSNVEAA